MEKYKGLLSGLFWLGVGLFALYMGFVDDLGFSPNRVRGIGGLIFLIGGYKTVGALLTAYSLFKLYSWFNGSDDTDDQPSAE